MRICESCGFESNDQDTKFCPKCGAELVEMAERTWHCENCGQENPSENRFCKSCGSSKDRKALQEIQEPESMTDNATSLMHKEYFKYAVIGLLVVLIGGLGSYFYFSSVNEERYLTYYAEASRQIADANGLLIGNVKADLLKTIKPEDLNKQLAEHKKAIDEAAANFTQRKPFKNYEAHQNNLIALLQKESAIIEKTESIVAKPLDASTDAALEGVKTDIDTVKELGAQIVVPNTSFVPSSDLAGIPQQLQIFVTETRKVNKEKMDKLAAFQAFFKKMDEAIQRYDSARDDLGKMMDSNRNGGMIWNDYFSMLDRAKSDRYSVRSTVKNIEAPAGTESLKSQFLEVLDESIRYCELMRIEANLRFNNYWRDASRKESEAREINKSVQNAYSAFIEKYNAEKVRLTNFANM